MYAKISKKVDMRWYEVNWRGMNSDRTECGALCTERGSKLNVCINVFMFLFVMVWSCSYYEAQCSGPGNCSGTSTCRHGFGSSWHQGHHGVRWHVSGDCHHRQHYHPPSHLFGNNWELNDCENGAKMCTSSVRQITINKHFRRAVNMSRLGSGTLHGQYNEHTGSFKPSDLEF